MVSYYVALMSTMFFLGSTIGSVCWGWISDRIGRKVTLLICLLCIGYFGCYSRIVNMVCLIWLGFCNRLKVALVIRLIHGLIDGTIPVTKAIQAEISTPKTIAFVSSLFFVGGSVGGYNCFFPNYEIGLWDL